MKFKVLAERFRIGLIGLVVVFVFSTGIAAEPKLYPKVGPGLYYFHERNGDRPWSIHILKFDRTRNDFQLTTTLAQETIFGLSTLSAQVRSVPAAMGEPVAAINGDFYRLSKGPYQGDPIGLQIYRGELVSEPTGPSFWVDLSGQPQLGEVRSLLCVIWPNGSVTPIGLNRERADNQAVLFTPRIGSSTRTVGGRELILEPTDVNDWLPLQAGRTYRAKVKTVSNSGNNPLKPDIMVLSIGPVVMKNLPPVKAGDIITIRTQTAPELRGVQTAIGGNVFLIRHGKQVSFKETRDWGEMMQERHPRTLIGWNRKDFYFVVVDGRKSDLSIGMNYAELSDLMQRLCCTEALNLDGGGSSTLWLGGQVMNVPSDGHERGLANALILLRKARPLPTTKSAPVR